MMRFLPWLLIVVGIAALGGVRSPGVPVTAVMVGAEFAYEVRAGDTLTGIGARFGVDVGVLATLNGVAATARLVPGATIAIDNRHAVPQPADDFRIIINIPQRMLFHYDVGELGGAYPVAAGGPGWRTPIADFVVRAREEHPTWDVPPSIQEEMRRSGRPVRTVVPPGPENPLGDYWLGTTLPNIGIHGTPATASIYRLVTHGCIRLHPDDIEVLFNAVREGDRGRIIYEPVILGDTPQGIFLEAHRDPYRRMNGDVLAAVRESARAAGIEARIDWAVAADVLRAREGIARRVGIASTKVPPLSETGSCLAARE